MPTTTLEPTRQVRTEHFRRDTPMYAHPNFDLLIAHERQAHERRIAADIRRARSQQDRQPIRRRIGERFIRLGERLIAEPASEPLWSR